MQTIEYYHLAERRFPADGEAIIGNVLIIR